MSLPKWSGYSRDETKLSFMLHQFLIMRKKFFFKQGIRKIKQLYPPNVM
jgi:hypothetical protein